MKFCLQTYHLEFSMGFSREHRRAVLFNNVYKFNFWAIQANRKRNSSLKEPEVLKTSVQLINFNWYQNHRPKGGIKVFPIFL